MISQEYCSSHIYYKRSCLNCDAVRHCPIEKWIDSPEVHSDFAKHGCVEYTGIYKSEPKRKGKPIGRGKWDKLRVSSVNR